MSTLIPAAEALAILRAAGVNAQKSPARGRCRTLCYLVAGQYVNLARLRELAREALAAQAEPAPTPTPAPEAEPAPAAELSGADAVFHLCRKFPISTPATWAPAVDRLRARGAVATVGAILRETERPAPAPALPGEARPGAAAPDARPVLPGETEPPAPVAQDGPAPELPRLRADAAAGRPVADTWAGQPWDPGTPEARARVALQAERVATLWPIAQAVRGAGFDLPPAWWADGPVMAGERTHGEALAALPLGAIAAAAAALAALPPVTTAQARALSLCRGEAVGV